MNSLARSPWESTGISAPENDISWDPAARKMLVNVFSLIKTRSRCTLAVFGLRLDCGVKILRHAGRMHKQNGGMSSF